jgi:hypothetical protein
MGSSTPLTIDIAPSRAAAGSEQMLEEELEAI